MRATGTSLRTWLIAPTMALLLGAVGICAWLLLRDHRSAMEEVTERLHADLAAQIQQYLGSYLETARQINGLNSDLLRDADLELDDPQRVSRRLWHQVQRFEAFAFVFIATPDGGAVGAGRNAEGVLVVDATDLDPGRGLVAGTRREYRADAAGRRGELLKATPNFDARQRPWFAKAIRHQGPVWSDIYLFFSEGTLAIAVSEAARDTDGELVGVAGIDLTLGGLGDFLSRLQVGAHGFIYLVDDLGRVVASSTGTVGDRDGSIHLSPAIDHADLRIAESARGLSWTAAGSRRHQQLTVDIEGAAHRVHMQPLDLDGPSPDWQIVTAMPESDYLASIRAGTRQTLMLIGAAVIVALLSALAVARRILIPVSHLSRASKQGASASGLLGRPSGIRELDEMARSFDSMSLQLADTLHELEDRVAERTNELSTAKQAADRASSAKSRFLATISHEVRTPLAAILGNAELLTGLDWRRPLSTGEALDVVESIDAISDNGRQVHQLLSDLLDLHRIESGRAELQPGPLRVAALLMALRAAFEPLAKEKGLAFHVDYRGALPWSITTDEARLRQVLNNLLSNAIKYTDDGEVRLEVRAIKTAGSAPSDPSNDSGVEPTMMVFAVSDTGRGIGNADRQRLFERFSRLDDDSRVEGFGLGLAIVRELLELLGGRLELTTELSMGSTFEVFLPLADAADWADSAPTLTIQSPPDSRWPSLTGRVVVADDSAAMRRLYVRTLERWQLDVTAVADGEELLTSVSDRPEKWPDAILVDWHMPRLDGLEATRRLRAGGYIGLILAVTAASTDDDRRACLEAGCDAYLSKPINLRELYATLSQRLRAAEDESALISSSDGYLKADLETLVRDYAATLPAEVTRLHHALETGDWPAFEASIHRLVGTAGSYGLGDVFTAAERLERTAVARDAVTAARRLDELAQQIEQTRSTI